MALGVLMVSSVAQAASPKARCLQEAESVTSLNLTGYNVIVGNNRKADNSNGKATDGNDVFCGFGGTDYIGTLDAGDIFISGAGNDQIDNNRGTFYGGEGDDIAVYNWDTFYGGAGNDSVTANYGTVNGGAGDDTVYYNDSSGTYNGGDGYDTVYDNNGTIDSSVELVVS
jgi:hypothetical protein